MHVEGAGDGDALLLASRELGGIGVGLGLEPHPRQDGHARFGRLFPRDLSDPDRGEGQVLEDGLVGIEVEGLEDHADRGPDLVDVGLVVGYFRTVDGHPASGGLLEQVHAPDQGALSRSRRTDDDELFPLGYMEVDVLQHVQTAEMLVDVFKFNHGCSKLLQPGTAPKCKGPSTPCFEHSQDIIKQFSCHVQKKSRSRPANKIRRSETGKRCRPLPHCLHSRRNQPLKQHKSRIFTFSPRLLPSI